MRRSRSILTVGTTALAVLCLAVSGTETATPFDDWGAPVNLGAPINTASAENGPAISKDGLSLYFSSTRPGGVGRQDIWVSHRNSEDEEWGTPINLGPNVNTDYNENVPSFSRDAHWMFFNSDNPAGLGGPGGLSNLDIWASWRPDPDDDFGWEPAEPLGPAVNSTLFDAGAGFLQVRNGEPLLYFGSERLSAPGLADIFVTEISPRFLGSHPRSVSDLSFSPPSLVPELSSPQNDARPQIRMDGLELFLQSNRFGTLGVNDLWVSSRPSLDDSWSAPINLGPTVNSPFNDLQPSISWDRRTVFFASDRGGNFDLYVTTRTKWTQQP